jgi:antitoxin YefM
VNEVNSVPQLSSATSVNFLIGFKARFALRRYCVCGIVQHLVIMEAVMQARTYSEARHDLKNVMDEACNNHEPILITRRKGESVVLLSLEDYESILESEYLLSSPANAARLLKSLEESRSGKRSSLDALGL